MENSIYTITPPDMRLSTRGPSICVLTTDGTFLAEVESCHEDLFKTVSVNIYHPAGEVTGDNLAWTIGVMHLCDNVFVDLDTVSNLGLLAAVTSNTTVTYVSRNKNNKDVIRLFNVCSDYNVYDSITDYFDLILDH
jgi:hypothetical protein